MMKKKAAPPRLARLLLGLFLTSEEKATILGDLDEYFFEEIKWSRRLSANLWYWRQAVGSAACLIKNSISWGVIMFKNYLKVTLRNFLKHKVYSLINITGLAAAMVCCILIFLWVLDELSFDRFHEHSEDLYIIGQHFELEQGRRATVATAASAVGPALKNDYPEVVQSARMSFSRGLTVAYKERIFNERIPFADPEIFKLFSYPILKGDPANPFNNGLKSIIISERMADKYFGDEEPIGKMLKIDDRFSFMVSAVMKNIPRNSTFRFDFLLPLAFLKEQGVDLNSWGSNDFFTFVRLTPGVDHRAFSQKIVHFQSSHLDDSQSEMFVFPYTKLRLYAMGRETARIQSVIIFSLVALAVLLVACINFINLTIARAKNRAKEVALRKVVGSNRRELIKQFFGESFLMVILALGLALLVVELFLPLFNAMVDKQLTLFGAAGKHILPGIILLVCLTGIISGIYPAFVISSFQPALVLKDGTGSMHKGFRFKKVLVVFQFTVSVFLIIATIVVYRQTTFMQNKDLGINKDNVLCIRGNFDIAGRFQTLKNEWLKNPAVLSVTNAMLRPSEMTMFDSSWQWPGKPADEKVGINKNWVGYDFHKTFDIKVVDGRFYSPEYTSDRKGGIVINQTLAEMMGPGSPVGKPFWRGSDKRVVIGVIKNFHHLPLNRRAGPLMLHLHEGRVDNMFVRVSPQGIPDTMAYIENVFKTVNPNSTYQAQFLDEFYGRMYRSYQQFGEIFFSFTILLILISCLGLLGLASFLAQQKAKEIGIRKVLGASVRNVTWLLSRQFLGWVLAANLIAWPAAYLLMNNWLKDFAYRAPISLWVFFGALLLSLLIALVTVSYQSLKAAFADPAKTLRQV